MSESSTWTSDIAPRPVSSGSDRTGPCSPRAGSGRDRGRPSMACSNRQFVVPPLGVAPSVSAIRGMPATAGTGGRRFPHDRQRVRSRGRPKILRSATPAGQPVRGRAVGTVLVLRHAGHPADLPLLLGRRRRPRHSGKHRHQHRRRLRRRRLPVHHPRRLDGRPAARPRARAVPQRRPRDVRAHRPGRPARAAGRQPSDSSSSRSAAAASRPTPPHWSVPCTTNTTSGATPASRCSTWASTSAPWPGRC